MRRFGSVTFTFGGNTYMHDTTIRAPEQRTAAQLRWHGAACGTCVRATARTPCQLARQALCAELRCATFENRPERRYTVQWRKTLSGANSSNFQNFFLAALFRKGHFSNTQRQFTHFALTTIQLLDCPAFAGGVIQGFGRTLLVASHHRAGPQ